MASINNATVGLDNFSGVGSTLLNVVNLKNFDLIDGGQINLTGGVHQLYLNSIGANTQIHLRELPEQFTTGSSGSIVGRRQRGQPAVRQSTWPGRNTLTSASGTPLIVNFASLSNVPASAATIGVNPGPPPAPPGIVLSVGSIHGRPRASSNLEDPNVFGYDPVANALIRFDATTGAELQTIPLSGLGVGTMTTGVALGRDAEQLVALIGNGSTIYAFNALTGAFVGQFSTANLSGFSSVDGIGSTDNRTVLMNSSAGSGGMAELIDLTASLATGTGGRCRQRVLAPERVHLRGRADRRGRPEHRLRHRLGLLQHPDPQPDPGRHHGDDRLPRAASSANRAGRL